MAVMYVYQSQDRELIRRALFAMSEMAVDEFTDEEVANMYPDNVTFILASLRGLTNELHRELSIVTENFSESEIARLDVLLAEITSTVLSELSAAGTPRLDLTGKTILTGTEVTQVLSESDELKRKLSVIVSRLSSIESALHVSGETKYRETRHVRTWYYDGEMTHGVKGLATVTDERTENTAGIGPDHTYVGTVSELVTFLRAMGYTSIDTDVEVLQLMWTESSDS